MGRVIVFGSINTDFVTYVDRLPATGETVTGGKFMTFPGGKGANQAVAAAKAGAKVDMYGCIGDDSSGRERITSLENAGVTTGNIIVKTETHSGIAQIIVDKTGENIIAVAPGANWLITPDDVILNDYPGNETVVVLFQNEIPLSTTMSLIKECHNREMLVIWNVAPALQKQPDKEILRSVDFLICNQPELVTLAGEGDTEISGRKLLSRGVANVIVTLGEKGSILVTAEKTHYQKAFPVKTVDTVGSGDCFCGVFACSLSLGKSVKESLKIASAAAALSTTVRGAQTSMPSAGEIKIYLDKINEG